MEMRNVGLDKIDPNRRLVYPAETVQDMCQDIGSNGIREPLVVELAGSRFRLVDGEKRWRACKMLGFTTVPANIVTGW